MNKRSTSSSDAASGTDSERAAQKGKPNAAVWLLVRLSISGALLWLLLRGTPLEELSSFFARTITNWPWLATALAITPGGILIGSLRLKCLLRAQHVDIRTTELMLLNLISSFYNQILPSTIGADVARTYWISRMPGIGKNDVSSSGPVVVATTVIVADRLLGAVGIVVTALLASALEPSVVRASPGLQTILPLIALSIVVVAATPFIPSRRFGKWLFSHPLLRRVRDKAVTTYKALKAYRSSLGLLFAAFLLSIALQIAIIFQYWTLANALRLDMSFKELAVLIPIVTLISMAPFTINGIGLRESALRTLGASLGFTAASAVALGWAFVMVKIFWALIGGVVHLVYRPSS